MNKTFEKIINKYIENEHLVNRIIVTVFVETNGLKVSQNELIKNLLISHSSKYYLEISSLFDTFSFENLIEAFEVAIPPNEQQTNGAVYTPKTIKDFITSQCLEALDKPFDQILCADISCGCGAFLYSLTIAIQELTDKSISRIIKDQIFGLDISHSSILRAKILLSLLALSKGEDIKELEFNLHNANALDFDWQAITKVKSNEGFDLVVGNPPYVRAKHIDEISKQLLKKWQVTKSGNPDLYIPFFEIGYKNLNPKGMLGYITVNTFYRSLNARSLRTYFEAYQVKLKIIDFGHEQVFANKLVYTCICFLSKEKSSQINFTKATLNSLLTLHKGHFTPISYKSLKSDRGWLLNNPKVINNINKIESCGTSLGKLYTIKNGIATLSNDTFIFRPTNENDHYYFFEKNNKLYKVEKGICRDIIKPNILKYEHEIPEVKEKLIYPYTNGISPLSLMKEDYFKNYYPMAYEYLWEQKERLGQRDKGNGDYGAWYAFGRTQALTDMGKKLLFPYMAKQPFFVYTDQEDMLIYCGYAIFSESEKELLVLKKLLESKVFNYYMQHTSKPYASGYYSYAKNYVKNFGVCQLSIEEKDYLLQEKEKEKINKFFEKKYEVKLA